MSRIPYRSALGLYFRALNSAVEDDTYSSVLGVLAKAIQTASEKIDRACQEGPEEFADAVTDTETQIIEDLLGVAFVVCQTQITAVTQAALRCEKQAGKTFSAFKSADQLRTFGPRFDTQYSKIEALWALANFFKHRDEWQPDAWTKPIGQAKRTVATITALGLAGGSSGNLRTGAEALGDPDYSTKVFEDVVRVWSDEVRSAVHRECFPP